ncbi:Predicted ATPase [Nonomuraea solani]|uniref:Predicted ATPase n=1 Tax=Nonomuraea solani TaxID=1144553 RepID=A0A1H6DVZ2_9ACTN|nr:XRE family transcriptional regulator [Nonomuraea solani]SEG89497.1 Predicted ATPase [Nonomuraea solani]
MSSGAHEGAETGAPIRGSALGALIRAWRERALLTQEQLAAKAELNVRTVRRLEAGDLGRPRNTSMRQLANALGLDAGEVSVLARAANETPQGPHLTRVTPQQLPTDVAAFVGRSRELAMLGGISDAATVAITAIDGMAGVGKTALAVHAAHQLAHLFPDGDLFIDLHGYTHGMAPADPADTIARVLDVLGVPGESIPQRLNDRAALYRSVLSGRKMLIVLDNAADEDQVRPLLPGREGCLVLITSRRRLVGLDGIRTVSVDVLPLPDAIALFTATAEKQRVEGVPEDTLAEVVRRCGLLPLAIRLAAARLRAHPTWSVTHLLERLEEHRRRLSELHAGQRSVTAALELSYRELSHDVRHAYRLLGLHPGMDIASDAAASLFASTVAQADELLEQLLDVHLLQETAPGRYRFHDLIRAHAADTVAAEESEIDRRTVLLRLLDHYCGAASATMDRFYPYEADMRPSLPSSTASMPDAAGASAWLEAELANLLALTQLAAKHGFHRQVLHLSATLHRCLRTRGRYTEAKTLHLQALSAAHATGDRTGEMKALIALGEIRRMQAQYQLGIDETTRALEIAQATGHRSGKLRALNGLGMLLAVQGQHIRATEYLTQALDIARAIGHRTGELDTLVALGNVHRLMGRHKQGAEYLKQAVSIAQTIGHPTSELRALIGLGQLHLGWRDNKPATRCFTRALTLARETGDQLGELHSLSSLGDLHRVQGQYEQARESYQQALDLAREIGNSNWQFEAVHALGRLNHDSGHADQALDCHRQALVLAELSDASDQARAQDGIAYAYAALGQHDQAHHHWSQALTILTSLGTDLTEERGVDVQSIRSHLAKLASVKPGQLPQTNPVPD